ncbi:DUF1003 domain-containing protein [Candidatus Wolfebacteria bacterium]|nr:DUF1003 domain-containing protein [Candidatus Wolfebacteria bacterium]
MNDKINPPSLEELKKLREPLKNINLEHKKTLSFLEKFAVWITKHIGSMGFFIIILFWTIIWTSWNIFAPASFQFDPFPAFVLWLFISNMVQLFLLPLIMIGQNLQGRHAETRAAADFEINVKAEREIGAILSHLEYQKDLILKILKRLEEK